MQEPLAIIDRLALDVSSRKVKVQSIDVVDDVTEVTEPGVEPQQWAKTGRRTYTIVTQENRNEGRVK